MQIDQFYFFDSLSNNDKKELLNITTKKTFSKDEILFYKGDEPKYLHLLTSGIVKIYKHDTKGNEIIIHNITAPSFIAEIANYNDIPYPANCTFESDSEVYLIDYDKFKRSFLNKPEVSMLFIKSLTKKIKALENFITLNLSSDSSVRIAKFLCENEHILPTLKQVKIASILNITPETLSRKITKFKKEGLIETNRGKIKILNKSELSLIAK
jgi:CRP/FNR family transcriptional regulator